MRARMTAAVGVAAMVAATAPAADLKDAPTKEGFPKFKVEQFAADLKIGYAVTVADVNGDKKPDIVVVDQHRVVWYENPTWKARTILQGKTKPDNVCITALDLDGGGDIEFVLGAGWKPADTTTPGTLQWLKRGKTLDDEWTMHAIPCDEPTVHRVHTADTDGDGKPELILAPLQGRGSSAKGNHTDGRPVRIMLYPIPADPVKGPWAPKVISEELHVVHNVWPYTMPGTNRFVSLLAASYEGYSAVQLTNGKAWSTSRVADGNQKNPKASRGSSEIKSGTLNAGAIGRAGLLVGTIEPWHGNEVVVYAKPDPTRPPTRVVVDDHLRWGHAVAFADLDGDGADELIAGVRDDPNAKAGDKHTERRGVRLYKCTDGQGTKWDRHVIEDGGVAVEDLTVADLNGDGKPDIVAVGRATGNGRIYWNQGK